MQLRIDFLRVVAMLATSLCCATVLVAATDRAEYDRIVGIQYQHEAEVLSKPGVRGMGIGIESDHFVFRVYVDSSYGGPTKFPVGGVDAHTMHVHDLVALSGPAPIPVGSPTANAVCGVGTIGIAVTDNQTGQGGYITNNHVAALTSTSHCPNAKGNKKQVAPRPDAPKCSSLPTIGTRVRFETIILGDRCDNEVDAAFVSTDRGVIDPRNTCAICPSTVSPVDPFDALEQKVEKCGEATCSTTGVVKETNVTILLSYCLVDTRFVRQIRIEGSPFSQPGDSGSVAYLKAADGSVKGPVGLVFAGDGTSTSFANPIQRVFDLLGVSPILPTCDRPATCKPWAPPPPAPLHKRLKKE